MIEPLTVATPATDRGRDRDRVDVLLIDHDPISRHVIESYLRGCDGLRLVAGLDRCGPGCEPYLPDVELAVICCGMAACCATPEGLPAAVRPMVTRGIQVLVLAAEWDRALMRSAIGAGVTGFLSKTPQLAGLAAGLVALRAGQGVLSPELLQSYYGPGDHGRPAPVGPGGPIGPVGPESLTAREREVLALLARGASTREAAVSLRVTAATIKSHISHSLTKLGARNRLEAVLLLQQDEG